MAVTVDDYPDVLRFESQLADRLGDHRTGFGRARVEQDMPLRCGKQPGAQSLRAHEIQWADDLHRLGWLNVREYRDPACLFHVRLPSYDTAVSILPPNTVPRD